MPFYGAGVNPKPTRAGVVLVLTGNPAPTEQFTSSVPGRDHEVADFHPVREIPQEPDPVGRVLAETPADQVLLDLPGGPVQIT